MTPQQYCQQKAKESGSNFTSSFIFLPKSNREAMIALYAFCREVDDVVDECTDYGVAQIKLDWWKVEIHHLFQQQAKHPVTRALEPVVQKFSLSQEHFLEIIDGMEMDLKFNRYADFKQLQLYCYRVASVVGLLTATILGFKNRKTLKYAHDLGIAFQLTNIIRDVGEDARRGRIYLPLDELARFNVSEENILHYRETPEIKALLQFQVERAEQYYNRALHELPDEDRKSQGIGLMMTAIYRTLLREIQLDGVEKVMNNKISLGKLHKLWLAFQTWRNL